MSLAVQELRKCLQQPSTGRSRRRQKPPLSPLPEGEPDYLPLSEEGTDSTGSPSPPAEEDETKSIYVCVLLPITNDSTEPEPPRRRSVSVEDATILTKLLSKRHRAEPVDLEVVKKEMMREKKVVEPQDDDSVLCYDFLVDV